MAFLHLSRDLHAGGTTSYDDNVQQFALFLVGDARYGGQLEHLLEAVLHLACIGNILQEEAVLLSAFKVGIKSAGDSDVHRKRKAFET